MERKSRFGDALTGHARLAVVGSVTVAALAGGGFALASASAPAASTQTYYGCVETSSRILENVHETPTTCPKGTFEVIWNQQGPKGATGPQGPAGPQGPPGPSDLTVTATTNVSARNEAGGNGNWAKDTLVRQLTLTRHEAVPVSNCGGAVATCWYYSGTLSDTGTFITDTGAFTPNQGGTYAGNKISGKVSGTFTGGSHLEFYASSNAPDPSLVPSALTGDNPSDANWYQQFFPVGTAFSGPANLIDWSWTYTAPNTCEQWTDAYNNSSGQLQVDGNIAGINECG